MKKYIVMMTLIVASSTNAWADQQLDQAKKMFSDNTRKVMQVLNLSAADMNKKQQKLRQNQQKIQGYRNPKNTPLEKQCINVMQHRVTNTQALVRNLLVRISNAQKQLPTLQKRANQARNITQLKQIMNQGNQILRQIKVTDENNNKQVQAMTKNVKAVCSRLPKK